MNKSDLEKLFSECKIVSNEGITSDDIEEIEEILEDDICRCVYWDYLWEDISASSENYNTLVTYQISFFSVNPPRKNKKMISFLKGLIKKGINIKVAHEFIDKSRTWHSYFSVDILENIFEE